MKQGAELRIAYAGGDAAFAPALAHGLAAAMAVPGPGYAVRVSLVDGLPGTDRRLAEYINLLARERRLALEADLRPAAQALDGAQLVLCSLAGAQNRARLAGVCARAGWEGPASAPGEVATAVALAPLALPLAREMSARCPDAPLVVLAEPPDILAGAMRRRFGHAGLRPVGLGHHIEALRGLLAVGLGLPEDDVTLVHGGVHGMGWVARFLAGGHDGYAELGGELAALGGRPGASAAHRLISEVYELTGLVPTSAGPGWPFPQSDELPPAAAEVLEAALAGGRTIPERGDGPGGVFRAEVGRALGRLARALATGEPAVLPLQLPYAGEALGWSPEVTVEVPAVATPGGIDPVQIGPLPAGVDGLPRMLGQQRAIASDYLAGPEEPLLRRALAATPEWGSPAQIRALSAGLHAEFGPDLEAALEG